MGSRKHIRAEQRKEERKTLYIARLRNVPTSPRKMRLVADLVRGMDVEQALGVLQFTPKEAAKKLYKLLRSAIANWEVKNEGARIEDNQLYIKEIKVDSGRMLKRIQPAPQGRAHRIRKRSNHVTLILGNRLDNQAAENKVETETTESK
ncbi:MAG: 50S ribosomal protein L22 [Bacteroidetes bacterium]|nr:MAG: 50S ribosomal protein L22 [Bacteroidota bacterium]RLD74586.1 MAG: 50S ribosomal protein L22 [Bacteroidota bacterium]RLD89644.1 MAG: 50S ribosomal protein L22 [Bacteroidota bacterium]